jgi:hypothetical protein
MKIIFRFREGSNLRALKHILENIDSDDEQKIEMQRNPQKKNRNRIIISNDNPLQGSDLLSNPNDPRGPYVSKEEFIEFKTQITTRFDNLLKGYGKLEGKFDAFNQVWRQEIGEIKSDLDEVKQKVQVTNNKIDTVNTNMFDGFKKLENAIRNLTINSNE